MIATLTCPYKITLFTFFIFHIQYCEKLTAIKRMQPNLSTACDQHQTISCFTKDQRLNRWASISKSGISILLVLVRMCNSNKFSTAVIINIKRASQLACIQRVYLTSKIQFF